MKVRKEKNSFLVLSFLLFVLGIFWVPEAQSDSGFGYRMKITVQANQVSNGPQTNFPFLFSTTSANLKYKDYSGGRVQNANGYDIIFRAMDTTTCGGTAPCTLNHEIEKYVASTGEFVAWVKVPSITNGTVLYVYYGNASITTSQEHKTGVWDSNYKGVWHLANPSSATFSSAGSSSWTVPANVTSITVKAWGAGGGGGDGSWTGGGGGFAQGTITVTPGETLKVYVGGGGAGGGYYGPGGGGGGGYSAVTRGSSPEIYLIQAGGGGGAGTSTNSTSGGAGGGISGVDASGSAGGKKGTTSAGGAGGTGASGNGTTGQANQGGLGGTSGGSGGGGSGGTNGGGAGGSIYFAGGGGGGGKYGGGGGADYSYAYGGGGGSDLVTGTNTVETAGSGATPGNNTDPAYTGSYGVGGGTNAAGHGGYVVISYGARDSTSNANDLTNHGLTAGTGQVDGCAVDNGSSYAKAGSAAINGNSSLTVEAWVKVANGYTTAAEIVGQYYSAASGAFDLWMNSNAGKTRIYVFNGSSSIIRESSITINDGNWHHVVGMFSGGSSLLEMYIDGALNNGTLTGSVPANTNTSTEPVQVGAYDSSGTDGSFPITGSIDEIRISASYRGADYVKTSYNNQHAPGTFYALDNEESGPPTIITLSSFSVAPAADGVHITWQTKSEVDNLGFNLFRTAPDGTGAVKLNGSLIPGLVSSAIGKEYTYTDTAIRGGATICYMLEDIDLHQQSTYHGPACAYWPAEGSSTSSQGAAYTLTGAGGASLQGGGSSTSSGSSQQALPGMLPPSAGPVTQVTMRSLSAIRAPEGVLIQWQTGFEVRNLGFHVYREDGGRRVRINHDLLLGSALIAGTHTILHSGHAYSFFDPGSPGGTYYVEDVDLSGKRTLHGPVLSVAGVLPEKKTRVQPLARPPQLRRLLANIDFPGGNHPQMTQFALAGIPALKLLIQKEGMYTVTFKELQDAGFDIRRPRMLQLYAEGIEQPLSVGTDGITFYATGVDTPFTDTRVYWLVNGITPGKRIGQSGGTGSPGPINFSSTVITKPRSFYFPALLNGEASNFFGNLIYPSGATLTMYTPHATQGSASLKVRLQGVTDSHHTIRVSVNGSFIGNLVFDGQTSYEALFSVSHLADTNQVSLTSSGEDDIAAVDTLILTYTRTYTADGDSLYMSASGGTGITVTGFTKPVRIYDVTDTVTEVVGQTQKEGVRIRVPGKGQRNLIALTDTGYLHLSLLPNTPSAWHNHRADLAIISHEDFKESLTPLVHLKKKQGLSVVLIDIEDLYDEFSYGEKTPDAIKAFVAKTRPHYVLLVGGATYDPRNFLGRGSLDYVPTKLVDTAMLETASDDWFVDPDGKGPEIPIGRLPVSTPQEVAAFVAKLVAYEQASPSTKALYVADIPDQVGDFESTIRPMESLISLIPEELFRSRLGDTTRPALLAKLTEGANLITYLGHGSLQLWDGDILDTSLADTLTNTTYPFVFAMTCLNGYFIIPGIDSLASALVTDTGGAVGMVASSSLTEFPPQAALGGAFLSYLSSGLTAGEALMRAKQTITDPDVQRSYILFGDPSMKIRR